MECLKRLEHATAVQMFETILHPFYGRVVGSTTYQAARLRDSVRPPIQRIATARKFRGIR